MKKIVYLFLPLFLFCFLISCEKENTNNKSQGRVIEKSGCKNFSLKSLSEISSDATQVDYLYNTETKELTLTHLNAGFNCCPEDINCSVSLTNDTIVIEEKEKLGYDVCCCNCLYDLTILVTNIELKKYVIKFIEPYYLGKEQLIFEADMKETEGSIVVDRDDHYPWGTY